jgi:2-dehydropantoate 2-reductase
MLADAREIAGKCGVALHNDVLTLDAARVPSHKTSMLQDMEKGQSLEYRAVFGAALEVADWHGLDIPSLRLVAALLRAKAEHLGLYPAA